jgi:outer membrane protein assembly factor BamB
MYRRRIMLVGGLSVAAVLLLSTAAAAVTAETAPWAQTNYNGSNSRANTVESSLTVTNATQIKYLRSVVAPPGNPDSLCDAGAALPVLANQNLYAISTDGVSAYKASTGALLWHAVVDSSGTERYNGLALANGLVLVGHDDGCETEDPVGGVSAYNATTGALVWQHGLDEAVEAMVVSGNTVVTGGADLPSGATVQALNVATGAVLWTKTFGECPESALVVEGLAIFNNCDTNQLVGASLATGATVWTKPGIWTIERGDSDATSGHHLYAIPASGVVTDLNPITGATRFTLAGASHTLAVDGTQVYAACNAGLCAYNRSTGALVWGENTAGIWNVDFTDIAIGGALLYGSNGTILRASTGAFLAILSDQTATSVVIGDARLAFTDNTRIIDLYGLSGS